MKHFVLYSILSMLPAIASFGQKSEVPPLSVKLQRFAQACINADHGLSTSNADIVQQAIDSMVALKVGKFEPPRFVYASGDTASLQGHVVFDALSLDSVLMNDMSGRFSTIDVSRLQNLRGDGADILYSNFAIKPSSSAIFHGRSSGKKELFIYAEEGTELEVVVRDERNGVESRAKPLPNGGYSFSWDMKRLSTFSVKITNPISKAVSFVVAMNN